jgi:two-component system, cell cycle sensor histidine kinase PleC
MIAAFLKPVLTIGGSVLRLAGREGAALSSGMANWTPRTFDDELLMTFARSRPKAILLQLIILLPILALGTLGQPLITLPAGAFLIGIGLFSSLFLADHWPKFSQSQSKICFLVFEALQGAGWAVLGFVSPAPDLVSDIDFLVFIPVALGGSALVFSSALRGAMAFQVLPILVMDLYRLALSDAAPSRDNIWLPFVLIGFFLYLGGRITEATLDHLTIRSEKDALIADLEQAKAHSDEARRRAEELNLAKSRFLATMSHELRTPLNAIMGFSEVMEAELLGRHRVKAYRTYARDIHESGQMLLGIIDEVLDLSRIEAGRYELVEKECHLAECVSECAHLLQLRAHSRGVIMMMTIDPALPPIRADERALRQITLNLLSNAIKFTPEAGEISIVVGALPSGGQFLQITDTGPGIPAHEIPIILESFGRGSLAVKRAEQGSGLGLPIVRGLVAMHGGEFSIQSREGEGTSVTITLPEFRVMAARPNDQPRDRKDRVAA